MTRRTIKNIVNAILKCDLSKQEPLGSLITSILFKDDALFISDSGECYPIVRGGDCELREFILGLSEIICIIDRLKECDAIYFSSSDSSPSFGRLFYSKKEDGTFKKTGKADTYHVNSNEVLIFKPDKCEMHCNGKLVRQGTPLCNELGAKLAEYMLSCVYPTFNLQEFVRYGYRFSEQQSIRIGSISVIVAIIIACLSPMITLLLSNRLGVTKLNKEQFEQIIGDISAKCLRDDTSGYSLNNPGELYENDSCCLDSTDSITGIKHRENVEYKHK